MRTTKAQQAQSHRLLIRTAVDLMTQHGFDGTTMKQIARAAEVGDATIYKYFPSKEKLVLAYFEQAVGDALTQMRKTKGLDKFSLQERMQLLVDHLLETLLPDREFVALAHQLLNKTPLALLSGALPGKALLQAAFTEMLEAAQECGEIPPCGFQGSLSSLMADYVYAVLGFWLRDTSDGFADTTRMTDLSLGVLTVALRSGLVDRLLELGGFMLRSQLARLLQPGGGWLDLMQRARQTLQTSGNP